MQRLAHEIDPVEMRTSQRGGTTFIFQAENRTRKLNQCGYADEPVDAPSSRVENEALKA